MDVTARELREGNIRDALRGYNHDDVDELLERAAVTIDGLSGRVAELTDRLNRLEGDASRGRETEEQLSRTLLVAQRTADEVVEEARAAAQRIEAEAGERAEQLVSEAEREAKVEIERERRRLEAEVLDLAQTRDVLDADVHSLTEFAEELRARTRSSLEAQLAELEARVLDLSGAPSLREVSLPAVEEGIEHDPRPTQVAAAVPEEALLLDEDLDEIDGIVEVEQVEEVVEISVEASDDLPDEEPIAREPAAEAAPEEAPAGERRATAGEVLDDDSFFASLREAVRDDRPLGPREDTLGPPETHGDLFDQDGEEPDSSRGIFRRRR